MISVIPISEKIKEIEKPWSPIEIARVNDQVVRLAMFKGSYPMHKHDNEDELFQVIQGKITIRLETNQKIELQEGEMAVIPKGLKHSPKSDLTSFVLMFEPYTLKSTGD